MIFLPRLSLIEWLPCWRLVPSLFPPVGLYDRVAKPEDLDIIFQIEALTNNRLRDEAGDITLVPVHERVTGLGTTPIMAAFTHLNPIGSRFTDGSYGVYYAARDIKTAIAETKFHRARFLAATKQPPIQIDMRSYASDLKAELHDIRQLQPDWPELYHNDQYGQAQALAKELRNLGSNGIVYDSVRDPVGECVAIFKPKALAPVKQGGHYCYVWDGKTMLDVYQKTAL
ncbi:MAG: RES family NAD+ phosphorylase [Methylococcaceae bacterium]|jgi:hypothetical protein